MVTRTEVKEPPPIVTEDTLLNEAMECPTDRDLDTRPAQAHNRGGGV